MSICHRQPPAVWFAASACLFAWAACAPRTDLVVEGSADPGSPGAMTAGAAALIDPMAGAGGVPVNLAAILVRFPSPVMVPDGALTISGDERPAGAGGPIATECPGGVGACFRVPLADMLMPSTTYLVSVGAGVVDAEGQPVASGSVGQFTTAAEADLTPPAISAFAVEPSGPCVIVTFQTDETAAGTLWIRGGGFELRVPAGVGARQFQVATSVAPFDGGTDVQLVARAVDLAGNAAETAAVSMTVPTGLLPVAITEVHANPAGPEPAQEFVEIRNLGREPVDVAGLAIEDSKGSDILPAALLDSGAYALIVPSGFDPASPVDTAPRLGTPLIRVDARIGSDGLANGGEVVRLRAAGGTVVSSYGGFVDVSAAKWSGKSVQRLPEDACDQAVAWSRLPSPATPGWGAE